MANNEFVKNKILKTFGQDAYTGDTINIKYLSETIFSNEENVQKINSIVHPPTTKKVEILSQELFKTHNIVFVESALIFEAKIHKAFDFIILVCSDEQLRINRTMERDNVTEESVKRKMSFQIPDDKKKDRVHFIIENNSTIEDLTKRLALILTILESYAK